MCNINPKIETLNVEIKELIITEMMLNLEEIMQKWTTLTHSTNYTGGKMRGIRGENIESFVKNCIHFIAENENINLVAKCGKSDLKILELKHNGVVISKKHQIDVHIYLDEKFIAVIECKAYLDSCMYVRACDDFKIFKEFGYNLKNCIFAFEDSMDNDTKIFTDHMNKDICDGYFCILDGKRSSSKPVYDTHFKKEINRERVSQFINFIYSLKSDINN